MSMRKGYLSALSLGMLFILTSVPISAAAVTGAVPIILVGHGDNQSTNWSGYAVTGSAGSITTALGTWTVPTVTCGSGETSYSAFWVGIDGFNSNTVEQTGTDSDCSHGTPTYYAWYEFYPKASKDISTITVHPGDIIAAEVKWSSGSTFVVGIKDITTGKTYETSGSVTSAQRTSAEFIAEAPETCVLTKCTLTSLSDFGTVGFGAANTGVTAATNCAVGEDGSVPTTIGSYGADVQEITMVSQSNSAVVKAQTSALSDAGSSFTIQWMNAGP